tara:strand:- start:4814 stop:6094 length:1281 start_codon:yes stop_codon:yes gene_type:complete
MSGSASRASIYSKMVINKDGKTANIAGKTVSFEYFESVYSPELTANLVFVDAGTSIAADKEQDTQERLGSIKDSLPITGYEDVEIKIESKSGVLDFVKEPFRVNGAPIIGQESNRQGVFLPLRSNPAVENLQPKNPCKKYTGRISDTVESILKNELNITKDRYDIDKTSNGYNFISEGRGALDVINDLCRKSIPVGGDPGYFFYETQNGFNFKSVDTLISQEPVETYTYSGGLKANLENDDNDFRILAQPNIRKDQDVLKALESGTYSSRNVFFNPRTFETDEKIYEIKLDEPKKTLGKKPPFIDKVSNYSRTNFHILDVGSLDNYVSKGINCDPREWQAKSPMRYNLLHSQIMDIQVPCNLALMAGNVIRCEFEKQSDQKEMGTIDQQQSGNYLILHLCHHFDGERSYTSMTLARDTYGLYNSKS